MTEFPLDNRQRPPGLRSRFQKWPEAIFQGLLSKTRVMETECMSMRSNFRLLALQDERESIFMGAQKIFSFRGNPSAV